jgi:hypothetical protein
MKNINTKIILMTTVLSAILLQSCTSLNEAAGKFNRACIFNRPFECVVECYFNGVTHSGFERTTKFIKLGVDVKKIIVVLIQKHIQPMTPKPKPIVI